jgi:hypothetical protein
VEVLKANKARVLFWLLVVIYALQSVLFATNKATLAKYHISQAAAHALVLTIAIPYIVIWIVGFIGYERLVRYVTAIRKSADGAAFQTIALGIMLLVLWLPFTTVVSGQFSHIYQSHHSLTGGLTIINNYLNLAILIPAFWLVRKGSRQLLAVIKQHEYVSFRTVIFMITFAALYVMVVLHDPARRVATGSAPVAAYYESDWLLIITIIIPRLIMWFLGIQAVHNIYRFMYRVKGAIYKDAIRGLANGICAVIITSMALRLVQSLGTQIGKLSLAFLLIVVYALLALISLGYILIAVSARRLRKIEEL